MRTVDQPDGAPLDLVEGGRPPRRPLDRRVSVALATVAALAALAAVVWVVQRPAAHPRAHTDQAQILGAPLGPSFTPVHYARPYVRAGTGHLGVLLRNYDVLRVVVDSAALQPAQQGGNHLPSWAQATAVWPTTAVPGFARARSTWPKVPRRGLSVAGSLGGAVVVVSVHPPCGSDPVPTARVVVRFHVGRRHFTQTIGRIPGSGRDWLAQLARRTCSAADA